jgi:hypothetical protein
MGVATGCADGRGKRLRGWELRAKKRFHAKALRRKETISRRDAEGAEAAKVYITSGLSEPRLGYFAQPTFADLAILPNPHLATFREQRLSNAIRGTAAVIL